MLKIECDACKEEVTVNMHLSQPAIYFQREGFNDRVLWTARVRGRAICPKCGVEI